MSFALTNGVLSVKPREMSTKELGELFTFVLQHRLTASVESDETLCFKRRTSLLKSAGNAAWRAQVLDILKAEGPQRVGKICKLIAAPNGTEPRAIRASVINTCRIMQNEGIIEQIHEGNSNFQTRWRLTANGDVGAATAVEETTAADIAENPDTLYTSTSHETATQEEFTSVPEDLELVSELGSETE